MPRPRPTNRRSTPLRLPLQFEVIERHVFHITNREVAEQLRQALAADDIERLDDLIAFLNDPGGADATSAVTTDVLECREVAR